MDWIVYRFKEQTIENGNYIQNKITEYSFKTWPAGEIEENWLSKTNNIIFNYETNKQRIFG